MRLTLRLLLAYLDNILEPADAKAVEAKIAESDNVANLVNHIRDITKRVRIPAPEVLGKGLGLDPNTVAEYLDYALSDDAVRDFENVCMSSDVHMAEVAACHEILSLVLVKPAEVDSAIRQRMYNLTAQPQPGLRAEPVATVVPVAVAQRAAAAPTLTPAEPRRRMEVPDYLRQDDVPPPAAGGRRFALAAAVLLFLLLGGAAAALALVPNERLPKPLRPIAEKWFANKPKTAQADSTDDKAMASTAETDDVPAGSAAGSPTSNATAATSDGVLSVAGLTQPDSARLPSAGVGRSTSPSITPLPPVPADTTGTAIGVVRPTGTAALAPMATPATTVLVAPMPAATTVATPIAVAQPPKIEPVGRVSSPVNQVLLRFDSQLGWTRMQSRDSVSVGDRLLTLPGYRPQIAFTNGLTVEMMGGTELELMPVDATSTPGIRLMRGRLMLFTVGGPVARLTLSVGSQQAVVSLSAAELALEHAFQRAPGVDPSAGPLPWKLTFYAKSGEIAWSTRAGDIALKSPSQWLLTDAAPLSQLPEGLPPPWITGDDRDPLEKSAADYIERSLSGGKAVTVALEETVNDRRIENVQLALRCLAQLGDYDDLVPYLLDANQRQANWEKYLDLLATSVDYGPYFADRVRDAFILKHGDSGVEIYRMIWGYSDDQLKAGNDKYLVECLDHESLDFRVVAYWNLMRITGQTFGYVPVEPPLKRRIAIQKWQKLLDDGKLVRKQG